MGPWNERAVVAVQEVRGDVRDAVRRALLAADWTRFVARGADVSLKVNLGWDLFIPGSITSPLVLEALIEEIRDHVGRIYVVEADQSWRTSSRRSTRAGWPRSARARARSG